MNTAKRDTDARSLRATRAADRQAAFLAGIDVPIVVVSEDQALRDAIRASANEDQEVHFAISLEQACYLAARGRCGILVTDQAVTPGALVALRAQMHACDPAAVTVAVGARGDDQALISLRASSLVERFMMKPLVPSTARLVLRSAASEYRSRQFTLSGHSMVKSRSFDASVSESGAVHAARDSVVAMNRAESEKSISAMKVRLPMPRSNFWGPATWMWIVSAVVAAGAVSWWAVYSPTSRIDAAPTIAANLLSAQAALATGRITEPAEDSALYYLSVVLALDPSNAIAREGVQDIATNLCEQVKTFMLEGRLAEAGIALERARRLSKDSHRIGLLEAELKRVQAHQLETLNARREP